MSGLCSHRKTAANQPLRPAVCMPLPSSLHASTNARLQGIGTTVAHCGGVCTALPAQVLTDEAMKAGILSRTPLKRIAQPSEVASVMVFLASPGAAYMTGQTIAVDGGYSVMGWW